MRFRHLRQVLRTFGSREAAEAFGKRQGDSRSDSEDKFGQIYRGLVVLRGAFGRRGWQLDYLNLHDSASFHTNSTRIWDPFCSAVSAFWFALRFSGWPEFDVDISRVS